MARKGLNYTGRAKKREVLSFADPSVLFKHFPGSWRRSQEERSPTVAFLLRNSDAKYRRQIRPLGVPLTRKPVPSQSRLYRSE